MNKRILAAILALLLIPFVFVSCVTYVSPVENSFTQGTTTAITTPEPPELPNPGEESYFEAHFIDVGQADSILIICDGEAMLVDAGNKADATLVRTYLEEQNVTHLEYAVGTHPHEDHIGGFVNLFRYIKPDKVYCSSKSYTTSAFNDFVYYVTNNLKQELVIPTLGESFLLGSARVTVIGPLHYNYSDINSHSIVLRVEYGELTFLLTGDMEGDAELDLVHAGIDLKADVLKVGHHGSGSSSYYQFLREVQATYGVISCGRDNDYGHPHDGPLSRLRDAEVQLYRTDLQGHIVCRSIDGKTVTFTVQMNPDAITNPTALYGDTSYLPTDLYYEEKFD